MFQSLKDATRNSTTAKRPELVLRCLLTELMQPTERGLSPAIRAQLSDCGEARCDAHPVWTELGPLVYKRVEMHRSELAPTVWAGLEREARLTAKRNEFFIEELERISARLAARRIPHMVIKGPTLAS